MNIKAYIDFFPEISERERSEQFTLLERAESDANSRFKLPIFKLIAALIPSSMVLLFVGVAYFLLALPTWSLIIAIVFGLLLSRMIVSELNARLLKTGLLNVLQTNNP